MKMLLMQKGCPVMVLLIMILLDMFYVIILIAFSEQIIQLINILMKLKIYLKNIKREYNIDSLEMDGLIISVAYQYLLDQGWNKKKTFWEYKDKKNIGVDISIRRTFYPATHGTQSRVMTIAEKYVWCAKHRIEAMLANRVKCSGYGRDDKFINDYSDLEKFINTYQDYINSKNKAHKDLWLHTDQMVCSQDDEYSIKKY